MRTSTTVLLVGFVLCVVAACSSLPQPSASDVPESSASAGPSVTGLPPGCEQLEELRSPTGDLVVLDGTWVEDIPVEQDPTTWWIRTVGDCVWGVGTVDEVPVVGRPTTVQSLRGRVGSDFAIVGEIVSVGPLDPGFGLHPVYAPVRINVNFDERGIFLREDRVQPGPRCPSVPATVCSPPLILRPVDADR